MVRAYQPLQIDKLKEVAFENYEREKLSSYRPIKGVENQDQNPTISRAISLSACSSQLCSPLVSLLLLNVASTFGIDLHETTIPHS